MWSSWSRKVLSLKLVAGSGIKKKWPLSLEAGSGGNPWKTAFRRSHRSGVCRPRRCAAVCHHGRHKRPPVLVKKDTFDCAITATPEVDTVRVSINHLVATLWTDQRSSG